MHIGGSKRKKQAAYDSKDKETPVDHNVQHQSEVKRSSILKEVRKSSDACSLQAQGPLHMNHLCQKGALGCRGRFRRECHWFTFLAVFATMVSRHRIGDTSNFQISGIDLPKCKMGLYQILNVFADTSHSVVIGVTAASLRTSRRWLVTGCNMARHSISAVLQDAMFVEQIALCVTKVQIWGTSAGQESSK